MFFILPPSKKLFFIDHQAKNYFLEIFSTFFMLLAAPTTKKLFFRNFFKIFYNFFTTKSTSIKKLGLALKGFIGSLRSVTQRDKGYDDSVSCN